MRVRRSGKCEVCKRACVEERVFDHQTSMFDPDYRPPIAGMLSKQLKEYRDSPIFCDDHKENVVIGGKDGRS